MGRNRKVEPEVALDRALRLFWAQGFHATSMEDVESATGLLKGSLYSHFGSKKRLYQLCLERYAQRVVVRRRSLVESAPTAAKGIRRFFDDLIKSSLREREFAGCFNTNSVIELTSSDPEFSALMRAKFRDWEAFWYNTLQRHAQETNRKPRASVLRARARALIALTQGFNVIAKTVDDPKFLKSMVGAGLEFLSPKDH